MTPRKNTLAVLATALALGWAGGPAWADKPDWAGHGHGHGRKHKEDDQGRDEHGRDHRPDRRDARVGRYFDDHDRQVVRVYYGEHYGGHKACPPGLAKKHNGCLPPGQARKYAVGQPLPQGVVLYPVPQPVLVQLPPPPPGHKYVRVAADVLLIAVGSSMVVDAITDLARM
ncbi:RcnB family protein [Ramlibacter humi]|uniref:RcnB family protein n=1 Tax=Ramlibacter humi TaxID=2530451 RepID=A0A4Z0BNK1_9BURK|nr:RcnB family protein [Ramlibacter humi]TFZ00352.1 hypothetical protein EZ216_14750 [Ramlibacter humi]